MKKYLLVTIILLLMLSGCAGGDTIRLLPATETPTPTATATPTPTPTATPIPPLVAGDTFTRTVDGMVMHFVPGGPFLMGAPEDDPDARSDERPQHPVTLSAFWMDRTEVTTAQYKLCVAAGACEEPFTRTAYDNPARANHPMTYISWDQAMDYCQWLADEIGWDVRLPTEAQWEKAASWDPLTETARRYPWGDILESSRVHRGTTTAAVGSYPAGASAYGILDLAGNVWEWVYDWYDANYYASQGSFTDPVGADRGIYRVMRGGAYDSTANFSTQLRVTYREVGRPEGSSQRAAKGPNLGFRCVVIGERLP